uniref:Cys_knot domain-containing protein n=1 Tax=Angiostrongylus cantonensis TaxID=6313 RepID=A0A0K0DR65_ANGCA
LNKHQIHCLLTTHIFLQSARSTYSDCFDDVIECAYRDPSSLIFCLNVYEHATPSMVHYSARCLSYEKFYVPDDTIKKIGANGMCKFADVQLCECDVCRTQTTTTVSTTTVLYNNGFLTLVRNSTFFLQF